MKKEMFTKTCIRCGLVFRTPDENTKVCPGCEKFSQKNRKRKKRKPADLSLLNVTRMLETYNNKHHTQYTYGQFINLISLNQINLEE